jgi:hypothetical protein
MSTYQLPAVQAHIHRDYRSMLDDPIMQFQDVAPAEDCLLLDAILSEYQELREMQLSDRLLQAIRKVLG